MVISPNFVRSGAMRCVIYSAVLLIIGGYWSFETWNGLSEGVLTQYTRGGRLIQIHSTEAGWYWVFSFRAFCSTIILLMGLRYILIFALPRDKRNEELTNLVQFNPEKKSMSTRSVVLVILFFIFIATIPIWR